MFRQNRKAKEFDQETIIRRIHAQWRRRAWFIGHALVFVSAILITMFFFRGLRVLTLLFAVWACVVAIHAVIFYLFEERDAALQRAIARAEERKRKNEEMKNPPVEHVVIGSDGELRPLDESLNDESFNDESFNDTSFSDASYDDDQKWSNL